MREREWERDKRREREFKDQFLFSNVFERDLSEIHTRFEPKPFWNPSQIRAKCNPNPNEMQSKSKRNAIQIRARSFWKSFINTKTVGFKSNVSSPYLLVRPTSKQQKTTITYYKLWSFISSEISKGFALYLLWIWFWFGWVSLAFGLHFVWIWFAFRLDLDCISLRFGWDLIRKRWRIGTQVSHNVQQCLTPLLLLLLLLFIWPQHTWYMVEAQPASCGVAIALIKEKNKSLESKNHHTKSNELSLEFKSQKHVAALDSLCFWLPREPLSSSSPSPSLFPLTQILRGGGTTSPQLAHEGSLPVPE